MFSRPTKGHFVNTVAWLRTSRAEELPLVVFVSVYFFQVVSGAQSFARRFSKHKLFMFQVYKGYVDDPRNTDNAWMETVAVNFHDDTGEVFNQFRLQVTSTPIPPIPHTHTRTHARTHARAHMHIHTSTQTSTRTHILKWVCRTPIFCSYKIIVF